MSLTLSFNATEVQPASSDFEPIPVGWYQFVIEKAELKPTKAGTGSMVSIMAKVQGPTHDNRVVFGNINYQNPNPQAQEIGQRQLSALCHAIGVLNLSNVAQLCGIPFEARVKITAATYNVANDKDSGVLYEARNEFQGFRAVGGATAAPIGTSSAPAAPSAPAKPVAAPAAPASVAKTVEAPAAQTTVVDPVAAAQKALADAQALVAAAAQSQPAIPDGTVETPAQPW